MPSKPYVAPWERQENESPEAFAAFVAYRDGGPDRSQAKAAREIGKDPGLTNRWCTRHDWVARARDYDNHVARIEREERERVRARQAAKWELAKLEGAQQNIDLAGTLRERVRRMLSFPLTSQKTKKLVESPDGRTIHQTIIIKPYRWGGDTIVKMLALAAQLEEKAILAALPADVGSVRDGAQVAEALERMIDQVYGEKPEEDGPAPEIEA